MPQTDDHKTADGDNDDDTATVEEAEAAGAAGAAGPAGPAAGAAAASFGLGWLGGPNRAGPAMEPFY